MARGQGGGALIRATALLLALASPAEAYLLCLGTEPRFAVVSDGATIQFDYVGDGTFDLDSPLPLPLELPLANRILTADPISFALHDRACTVYGVTQALTIELIIPSNGSTVTFQGCCSDRRRPAE